MNNNFHIRSLIGEEATCWPISENMVRVNWDSGTTENWMKKDLDKMVERNGWEYIGPPEDELPRTFKFYHYQNKSRIYSAKTMDKSSVKVDWEDDRDGNGITYCKEEVNNNLEKGYWIIIPEQQPEKNFIDTIQIKIALEGLEEAKEALGEFINQSSTVLEKIKSFTSDTGHDVYISKGVYKVYRKDEDSPYSCYSEEFLVQVMDAILTLDAAEKA